MAAISICSVDGCCKPAKSRGWCNTHYERWRINGAPTALAPKATLEERFHSKYEVDAFGCWIWTGARHGDGYGHFGVGGSGVHEKAHRVSYKIHVGPIPDGLIVCHKCDVRPCVNPDHLFLGTYQDNIDDAVSKGRMAVGERSGVSRLTEDDVRLIRESPLSERKIATLLGVHRGTVNAVRSGRTWGHLK